MLYRIFTERKNVKFIRQLVFEHYEGFTVFNSVGYWQGKKERSLCIEIISDLPAAADKTKIELITRRINEHNKQDCCLVQEINCKSKFI